MTRDLVVVDPADVAAVVVAMRAALSGDGPAVLPHPGQPEGLPATVERRVAVVVETSGSTGRPKRVALSADALLASAAASESSLGGPGQWLLALPANYVAGVNVIVRSIAAGTDPVLFGAGHFDAHAFAEAASTMDGDLRFTSLVPAQLARVVDAAEQDIAVLEWMRRFDRMLIGGQATDPGLLTRSFELGLNLTRTYGSSETSGGCVYDGVPLGRVHVRVIDGELQLGGPTLADGYLDDPGRTASAFLVEEGQRWYRTGDGGEFVDGVVRVTGRLDGVIISGGIKVSLDEVEAAVRSMPGLGDGVVVRAPHERWGEVPVVVTTATVHLADVRAEVARTLGPAAAPATVLTIAQIPLTATGKPDRRALEALVAEKLASPPH